MVDTDLPVETVDHAKYHGIGIGPIPKLPPRANMSGNISNLIIPFGAGEVKGT
jgi:hypothetical protein